jgi:hypothetical protein
VRRNGDSDASARFIERSKRIRRSRGLSAKDWAELVSSAGYPLTHQMTRNQETRPEYRVPLEQALAVSRMLGIPLETLLREVSCVVCNDTPAPQTRCLACGVENRGA